MEAMCEMEVLSGALSAMDGDMIQKLFIIEDELKKRPQVEIPVKHYFSNGVYVREMTAPKGALIIGRLHKFSQVNIVLRGSISVLTESGWKRFSAGATFESPAGIKRAGYTHEETVWTTICGTQETDIDKVEEALTIGTYQEYLQYKQGDSLCLSSPQER